MKVISWLIYLPLAFALSVGAALIEAVVLVKLNGWFVMPIFHTPQFGYWQAAGLALIFGLLSNHADMATEVEGHEIWARFLRTLLRPAIMLGLGWCFKVWAQ